MLERFFNWELLLFTTTDLSWAGFVLIGLIIGRYLRLFAVKSDQEFSRMLRGLVAVWLVLHVINYFTYGKASGLVTLLMSFLGAFSPVVSFTIISYLLIHMVKKVKDDV